MADIEKLKALAEAAPKGEWSFDVAIPERGFCAQVWDAEGNDLATLHATPEASAAAQFIAEANPAAILELIAEVEALRAEREARDWEMKAQGIESVIHFVVSKRDQDVLRMHADGKRAEGNRVAALSGKGGAQ